MPSDKDKPPKPDVKPDPSKPIDDKTKDKAETKIKTHGLHKGLLKYAEIPVTGSITAGTWVAEIDKTNIRSNSLRLGEM